MSASPFDGSALPTATLLDQLCAHFPGAGRGHVETVMVEEHEILVGGEPGDVVPGVLFAAVLERLQREAGAHPDGGALPA
ncbi:hypothetical protein [Schumannella sp. 10F1B-5-1]|uniref:hypothetical protein n=1 Tax=Schumannella sp. 10F1B-5-1 TaxID=2590780 RepID=UPI001131F1B0|nr:hypothetical protein [Schumannella sp. 10F1B-5-1]TPW72910.1 hypothetical protein FJ658_06540 [Schumannella sp. 10F1B-5-1]